MSRRIDIVLPGPVADQLRELAAAAGEPTATLAGRLLRDALTSTSKHRRPRRVPTEVPVRRAGRPPWLEPYGGDHAWRQEVWGAIVALHGRYPRHLGELKIGWWSDEAHTEILCALAVWRAEIDDTGNDPREEIAFHAQLADYQHTLRSEPGGTAQTWRPGPPPEDWTGR